MDIANTLKREVYRNLRYRDEHVYSVRKDGLVEGTALCVVMDGRIKGAVKFAVGEKGNERVRDEMRKNVHAVTRGYMVNAVWRYDSMDAFELGWANDAAKDLKDREMDKREGYKWVEVTYNPYKYRTFVSIDTDPFRSTENVIEPIFTARKVIITDKVWAQVSADDSGN
tara:strand:+ start:163 stop:669 length:507 start_codon:yes stop_codon:yes gene_type:complete